MDKTDWMYEKKWGVFVHYLECCMNNPENPRSMGRKTSWDECIHDFDCDLFAKQLHEAGAGWLMLTIMQQSKYMIAPNETFNKISGYQPGEACSEVDLVEKMYTALNKYDIDLFLYFTGDGPTRDPIASKAFEAWNDDAPELKKSFVEKWASVAKEYSLRYGEKIKGWWHDGCWIGYNDELLKIWADAFRAGNPDALIATNLFGCLDQYGCLVERVRKGATYDDYTAGELVHFSDIPYAPFIGDARWHLLSFLGVPPDKRAYNGWGATGSKYSPEWMKDYLSKVYDLGGVITIDICAFRDGHIDPVQLEVLKALKSI